MRPFRKFASNLCIAAGVLTSSIGWPGVPLAMAQYPSTNYPAVTPANATEDLSDSEETQYSSTQYPGFRVAQRLDFATSRPGVSDSVSSGQGADHRSMSPDSWGSSNQSFQDPFASTRQRQSVPRAPLVNIRPPAGDQEFVKSNQFVPHRNPGNGLTIPRTPDGNNDFRPPGTNDFRPADYENRDPRNIPLAPTVPENILDENEDTSDVVLLNGPGTSDPSPQLVAPESNADLPAEISGTLSVPEMERYPLEPEALPEPKNEAPRSGLPSAKDTEIPESVLLPPSATEVPSHVPSQPPQGFVRAPARQPVDAPFNQPAQIPLQTDGFGWGNAPGLNRRPSRPIPSPPGFWKPTIPRFRPDLGQRSPQPRMRHAGTYDSGHKQFDFENKKREYPPFSEILATGRYFYSSEALFERAFFQGNNSVTTVGSFQGQSRVYDYDYELNPRLRLGFESKYGPGFELDWRQFRGGSIIEDFTSDGVTTGTASAILGQSDIVSTIAADDVGEQLLAQHLIQMETFGLSVFKEVQLPISRINGQFGFQFLRLEQQQNVELRDGGGAQIGLLRSLSDMRAFGPRVKLEYFRPVGHTPLEFITSFGGSLMFGRRDQFIQNTVTGDLQRPGADEFVSSFDFLSGIQMKKRIGENRAVYGRVALVNQSFANGGNASVPQSDFGLRGFSFMAGYNR